MRIAAIVRQHTRLIVLSSVMMIGAAAATLSAVSCAEPAVPSLEVTPSATSLITGQTAQLVVTRHFPGGPIETVSDRVGYTSSNRAVASVSDKGVVTAGEPGTVTIRIYDTASDAVTSVSFVISSAKIQAIDVIPGAAVLAPSTTRRFVAMARLTTGEQKDLTNQVVWSSSNEAVVSVGRTGAEGGLVTAVADGDATITATESTEVIRGQSLVFVRGSASTVRAIVVSPNPAEIPLGGATSFTATGLFGDGTSRDLTSAASWSSSNSAVATVDATGKASGVALGGVTISASMSDGAADAGADAATVRGSAAATVK